jgi:dTDP-4-amino-4,6-dideoxygalactose transaminase
MPPKVPFNVPRLTGRERTYLEDALGRRDLAGNSAYTQRCHAWFRERLGVREALLTHSCTAALEMAAILAGLGPGDEVIMPSYTFVSTANAVVLRGAVPVFVDIRPDTLNIDEAGIEAAITDRTKAIVAIHYAGVCAEMDAIRAIARRQGLLVIEDAAQALLSSYHGRSAGSLGDLACFSFHSSKNVVSGEGGVLILNRAELCDRAGVIWEKGTNRRQFLAGAVDKYSWVDIGSSYFPSELTAAFLLAQLEEADGIIADRRATWTLYHGAFADLEARGDGFRRPIVPPHCQHNGHLYYLLMPGERSRDTMIAMLAAEGIDVRFHYVPLHSAPAGKRYGRCHGTLKVTDDLSARLLRLPLYAGIDDLALRVVERIHAICNTVAPSARVAGRVPVLDGSSC